MLKIHLGSWAHHTNDFPCRIQILWKFHFVIILLLAVILLPNFAHASTAQLPWHVQNFATVIISKFEWELCKLFKEKKNLLAKQTPDHCRCVIHWHLDRMVEIVQTTFSFFLQSITFQKKKKNLKCVLIGSNWQKVRISRGNGACYKNLTKTLAEPVSTKCCAFTRFE